MIEIRSIKIEDIPVIQALVDRCRPYVAPHKDYNYWMLAHFSPEYTVLAWDGDRAVGFLSGYPIQESSNRMFAIQICVDPEYRGQGIASSLLEEQFDRHALDGKFYLECTINPDNQASWKTFEKFASVHGGTSGWNDKTYEAEIPERGYWVEI